MYRKGRPGTGAYLDVRRYAAIDVELMRLIDMAHTRDSSTLQGAERYLGHLSNFGQKYSIELFLKAPIAQPPRSAIIPLMWGILE
jgi:hypothetical protein